MHHAETIMQTLFAQLQNLTATGTNVERGRGQPVTVTPALTLEQGADQLSDGVNNTAFIDRLLNVRVIAHVKTGAQFDTELNQIRQEVFIALMADRTQGLSSIVLDTIPTGDDDPELSVEIDQKVGRQVMNFDIKYRHSLTNPGA